MLAKKNKNTYQPSSDELQLIELMKRITAGDFSNADVAEFKNPQTGELFNSMLEAFKISNNSFVMRMNNSMAYIANSSNIMQMIEQLQSQDSRIRDMQSSSQDLDDSVDDISSAVESIKEEVHDALISSGQSVNNMNKNILVVKESAQMVSEINNMILTFREKTNKINEIIDIIKKIASKSGLLALNASIEAARAGEAGKGFAVVANQVKDLSSSTTSSAEDVVRYVGELQSSIAELVDSIDETTKHLQDGNLIIENSVADIKKVNTQMDSITNKIDDIYNSIKVQNSVTDIFLNALKELSSSYNVLSDGCIKTGEQMYKVTRSVDLVRSDMAKDAAKLYPLDMINVFEVDHIIFTWRIYNNLAGYEKLRIEQVNNPNGCKLGKWINNQKDKQITSSNAYKRLKSAHEELHSHAVNSFTAAQEGNRALALEHFQKVHATLPIVTEQLAKIRELMKRLGEANMTEFTRSLT